MFPCSLSTHIFTSFTMFVTLLKLSKFSIVDYFWNKYLFAKQHKTFHKSNNENINLFGQKLESSGKCLFFRKLIMWAIYYSFFYSKNYNFLSAMSKDKTFAWLNLFYARINYILNGLRTSLFTTYHFHVAVSVVSWLPF